LPSTTSHNIRNHAAFIWSVADLLRGDYKQSEYGRVILPLVVLRRLDCVLEPTKARVLQASARHAGKVENVEPLLRQAAADEQFFNTSPLTLPRLLDDPPHLADNLRSYLLAFSPGARDVLEKFDLPGQIDRLDRADLLYLVVSKFCDLDLHPEAVSNLEMGYLYEDLIRRFSELSNETAGEHFTPREVIRLMVNLLFISDDQLLTKRGVVKTLLDPAAGTGGMLSVAEDHLRSLNPLATLQVYGQELNPETYAICRSDMMLKDQDASHIVLGNSFSDDGFAGQRFDYLLANPPFGVERKKVERAIRDEHGFQGVRRALRGGAAAHQRRVDSVPAAHGRQDEADFLDAETARIDALIAKKRHLIAALRVRRAAVTLAGVCGEPTSSAARVRATLPWLTSHPEGWATVKLKFVAGLGSGHTPSRDHPEWWLDCSIPWITTGEVVQMRDDRIEHLTHTREQVSDLGVANSSATVHPAGTVVLSRTASAGFSAIMGTDMATSQDFVTWRCGPLFDARYLLLCLRAMRRDLLERLAQRSTHKTIYMPDVESIRIPLPPLGEQREWSREPGGD